MTESEVRAYTVLSHGAPLARKHLYDWLILLLLIGVQVGVNIINPFYRFVGKDMMDDIKYPFHPNTIPFWTVYVYCILLPIIFFFVRYLKRKDVHDLHHAILGLLYAMVITGIITDAIKNGVGRPRPNFFYRCFPNGKDHYDKLGNVRCNGEPKDIREGHKSFPSGHTSLSFAGLGFLSLYLAAKVQAFDRKGHICKICVVVVPLLAAALVGVSRVDDYWHHWTDVFAGALIGLTVSLFCYLQFFSLPHHTKGWGPYSYFTALERESQTTQTNDHSENQPSEEMISPQRLASAQSKPEDHSVTIQ